MQTPFKLLIGGELVAGAATVPVINPASGEPFAHAPVADVAMVNAAVEAANRAFGQWAASPPAQRKALLEQLAREMDAHAEELAQVLTREQGKPLRFARAEVTRAAQRIRDLLTLELADRVLEQTPSGRIVDQVLPLGVVAAITPWNFPVAMLVNKLAPALLTGNCVIVKPAPSTPLTTLKIGEICQRIFPAGVVSVIADRNDLGQCLSEHPGIAKVSFTGSTLTGRRVMASAAGTLKRITLELGGNDGALVLDDVDVADAARKVFAGAMMNSGQVCLAIKRAYVPERIHDEFCERLRQLADAAVVGDGMDPRTELGPVQNKAQFERVAALIRAAAATGRIIAGGESLDRPGYFIPPTIVADLDEAAPLVAEEQFGPVLPVLRYSALADAIAAMNDSPYALGATVWTSDPARGADVATRLLAGTVWVNHHLDVRHDIPFRGLKQSGFGVELGVEGLNEFVQHRIVNVRLAA